MELFATIGNDRKLQMSSSDGLTNKGQYLHVAAITQPSLQAKLKSNENGHALKVVSDTISCFVDVLLHFSSLPITFYFTNIMFQFEN